MQDIRDKINAIEDIEQITGSKVREMMLALMDYMEVNIKVERLSKEFYKRMKTKE